MEERSEFSEEFEKNQKVLMKKQQNFESEEKKRFEKKDEVDLAEKKKMKLISWAVIIAMTVLVLILAVSLL